MTQRERGALAQTSGAMPLALLLTVFAAVAYGAALNMPFIGDDFVFLDEIRGAKFVNLWSFSHTFAGWYRPWSREFHFWLLHGIAGLHPTAYRAFGIALWLTALNLFAAIVRRLTTDSIAMIATAGAASMALWGTPLLWISGSQDLWMLALSMASLYLVQRRQDAWAIVPFVLALLSKETSAVLPGLIVAYLVMIERMRLPAAIRRTTGFWALLLVWLVVHPTLRARLLPGVPMTSELEARPAAPIMFMRTILAPLNLDMMPRPTEVTTAFAFRVLISALLLASGLAWLLRRKADVTGRSDSSPERGAVVRLAIAWMALGWLPLLSPSIAWHAYYGCLGALGMWLALAMWLAPRRALAIGLIGCMGLIRGAQASTPSWDWGNEWYQRRAGDMLASIRADLVREHPNLPHHSRIFFGHIPNNIGLIAGRSPALRVWYADSTLQAGYYSSYRPRTNAETPGPDFFFRFDTLRGMVEVKAGDEDVQRAKASNPEWESDHEKLAMTFLRSGDTARAAVEFEKVSLVPSRAAAAVYAAVCWDVTGNSVRADSLIASAQTRLELSSKRMRQWVQQLKSTLPGR